MKKSSPLRQEIEALLRQKGLIMENRISVANLDTKELHYFQSYPEALEFLKGKKGRWYLTAPGLKYAEKKHR